MPDDIVARCRFMVPDVAFDLALEHGRCVVVRLPEDDAAVEALAQGQLPPEERSFALSLPVRRRRTWVGGRVAIRHALAGAGLEVPPILTDSRGAPMLPPGIAGSISHKETLAAGLVAHEPRARIGVDLELDVERSTDVSSRVLADDELSELADLEKRVRAREVLVRFSAKEAIYKALDPFVHRYVGFKEVSVSTRGDGSARVVWRLHDGEGPFAIDVHWKRFEGIVLSTARVELLP